MSDTKNKTIDDLFVRVSTNLNKLKNAMGWSQKEFADKWGIASGSINNYLKTDTKDPRIPSLDVLLNLCSIPDFEKAGLEFGIDDLLDEAFNPESTIKFKKGMLNATALYIPHEDFIGNYLCYYNDQSDLADRFGKKRRRELRYGVLSIFDDVNGVTAKRTMRVAATFFKEENRQMAIDLKNELDTINFNNMTDERFSGNRTERNNSIIAKMSACSGIYKGELTFSDHFAFIDIISEAYSDKALMILYIPPKNNQTNYIGGIGTLTSVSHGRNHTPSAQKIILSKYELACSDQDIAPYLNMAFPNFTQKDDGRAISNFCSKLYNGEIKGLDENDKIVVIQNRINKINEDYIRDNLCCSSTVSEMEDAKVYQLILASMKK